MFLKKNTSIGKTLQRAKALQKSHEHFESVARVSFSFYKLCLLLGFYGKYAECHESVPLCQERMSGGWGVGGATE